MTPSEQSDCGYAGSRNYSYGKLGCRCDACKAGMAAYRAQWMAKRPGYMAAAKRRFRSDPEKAERDREYSRRWKREHLGQPGLPARSSS